VSWLEDNPIDGSVVTAGPTTSLVTSGGTCLPPPSSASMTCERPLSSSSRDIPSYHEDPRRHLCIACCATKNALPELERLRSQTEAGLRSLGDLRTKIDEARCELERTRLDVDNALREWKRSDRSNDDIADPSFPTNGKQEATRDASLREVEKEQVVHGEVQITSDIFRTYHCDGYLLVSPEEYTSNLCTELSVHTLADLAEAMERSLEVLASVANGTASEEDAVFYNIVFGTVVQGMEEPFCKDLLAAAAVGTAKSFYKTEEDGLSTKLDGTMKNRVASPTNVANELCNPESFDMAAAEKKPSQDCSWLPNSVRREMKTAQTFPMESTSILPPWTNANIEPPKESKQQENQCRTPLSATARSFEPKAKSGLGYHSPLSVSAPPFQPKNKAPSIPASFPEKAVVVEISAPAAKAPTLRPAPLPGMEYLMGVDDARVQAEKMARANARLEQTKRSEDDTEKEKTDAVKKKSASTNIAEKQDVDGGKPLEETNSHAKSSATTVAEAADVDEMPELDDIMSLIENRSMSKEERQKRIDEMFGKE